ncbi:hypothetical protein JW711_01235 [Candidatus Woesearchaeota archaeon]|nr:hypothetical protein [Candidatus Woesearchaeota archaeon]
MADSIVSVRMPSSLVQTLKSLSKENHFLDVSEEIRSIVRIKTREYKVKIGTSKLTETKPAKQTDFKTENIVKEELVRKLKAMIEELENENQ